MWSELFWWHKRDLHNVIIVVIINVVVDRCIFILNGKKILKFKLFGMHVSKVQPTQVVSNGSLYDNIFSDNV